MQRANIVTLWRRNLLLLNLLCPKSMSNLRFRDADWCQVGIGPGHCVVAVKLRPVTLGTTSQRAP